MLIDLLLDPFDDVRSTAAEIMSLVEVETPQALRDHTPSDETLLLLPVLNQAEEMMKLSGRADQADGVDMLQGADPDLKDLEAQVSQDIF